MRSFLFLSSLVLIISTLFAGEKIPVSGGLSNQNFMEFLGEQAVFVKYKPDTIEILGTSWDREVKATCQAQNLGLCPPLLWIDQENKSMAFYFLKDAKGYNRANPKEQQLLCQSLNLLHNQAPQGISFIPTQQIRSELEPFEASDKANTLWMKEASTLLHRLESKQALFPFEMHPCHLDLWTPNIVCTQEASSPRLWILDWEYAADCDPDYDLAVFFILDSFSPSEEEDFLHAYGKPLTQEKHLRMLYMKSLACLRIASWYATKSVICDKKDMDPLTWVYLEKAKTLASDLELALEPSTEPSNESFPESSLDQEPSTTP